jgi:hypothetical protein
MARPLISGNDLEAEIERIRSLGVDDVRTRWRAVFGKAPPAALTKDLLARMLAWRIQEQAFGGIDRTTAKLLDGLARGESRGAEDKRQLKPGTVLVREYQGERHTVTVTPDGFIWRETTYSSLSTIARAITGTAWNGPRFFGLRVGGDKVRNGEPEGSGRPVDASSSAKPSVSTAKSGRSGRRAHASRRAGVQS